MLASPHLPGFASVAGPRPALHQRRQQLDDCVWMWARVRRLSSWLKCSNPAPPQLPPSGCSGKTCSLCPQKWQDRTFAYGTRPSVREARTRPLWRPHAPIPQACPFHQCLIENGKSAKVDLTMVARKLVGALNLAVNNHIFRLHHLLAPHMVLILFRAITQRKQGLLLENTSTTRRRSYWA